MFKKTVLILVSIPLYLGMGLFDIVKLPISIIPIAVILLIAWAKNDFKWGEEKKAILSFLIIGVWIVTDILFDIDLLEKKDKSQEYIKRYVETDHYMVDDGIQVDPVGGFAERVDV